MALSPGLARGELRGKFYQEGVAALAAYVEWEARLDRRRDDGASERDHLEAARRQIANLPGWKGKRPEQIVPVAPEYPPAFEYLLGLLAEHSLGLEQNGMGPALATWGGLQAWNALMRHALEPWELRAIARLSYVRAAVQSEQLAAKTRTDGAQSQNRSG